MFQFLKNFFFESILAAMCFIILGLVWCSGMVNSLSSALISIPLKKEIVWDSNKEVFYVKPSKEIAGHLVLLNTKLSKNEAIECSFEKIKHKRILFQNYNSGAKALIKDNYNGELKDGHLTIESLNLSRGYNVASVFLGDANFGISSPTVTNGEYHISKGVILSYFEIFLILILGAFLFYISRNLTIHVKKALVTEIKNREKVSNIIQ